MVKKRSATGPSLWERLDDRSGDNALFELLDIASFRYPVEELIDVVDRFRVKCL